MCTSAGAVAAVVVLAATGPAQVGDTSTNRPPVVAVSWPTPAVFAHDDVLHFTLTVTDPDGDPVSARLIRAPELIGFRPIRQEPSGVRREVAWHPGRREGGSRELVVEAWDRSGSGRRVQHRFPYLLLGAVETSAVELVDLDGDLDLEIVGRAPEADLPGARGAGAFLFFDEPRSAAGLVAAPTRLIADVPTAGAQLGFSSQELFRNAIGQNLQVADLTGDGRLDLLGADAAQGTTVYVWSAPAGLHGDVAPTAVLHGNDPDDTLFTNGQSVLLADVTHDGVMDVITVAPEADTAVQDVGEICVFAGGAAMSGSPAPTATLRIPGAVTRDLLGFCETQGVLVGDVSGDGAADIVGIASRADRGATTDVGMLFVWSGGAALTGTPAPVAVLDTASAKVNDSFGDYGATLVDVTGDGVLDVVVAGPHIGFGGSIFVWRGGPTLTGTLEATVRLRQAVPTQEDRIGYVPPAKGVHFADLDLDGITDVLAVGPQVDLGTAVDAGAIYFWSVGAATGTLFETARLERQVPAAGDRLGEAIDGVQIVDVTGDGRADVVAVTPLADAAAVDAGAIDVWEARSGLSGTVKPSAALEVPGAAPLDQLGNSGTALQRGAAVLIVDVTGDGVADVVAAAPLADVGGAADAGAAYVWHGGAGMTAGGTRTPSATLLDPAAQAGSKLGWGDSTDLPAVAVGDANGDGILDVAIGVDQQSVAPTVPARVQLWLGGAGLVGTPAPTATAASLQPPDRFAFTRERFELADVTDDGIADLVVGASSYDWPQAPDAGALCVFAGGASVSGTWVPLALLRDPDARRNDALGYARTVLRDVDHDGHDDLVVPVPFRGNRPQQNAGGLLRFHGPITAVPADPDLMVPDPTLGKWLYFGQ